MFFISQPSRNCQYGLFFLLLAASITMMFTATADAQQPWRAVNKAAKKYDKAVRDAQRTQDQYNKRVYRQQEKLYRQNDQAIRKFYRTGKPAAVVLPFEPAPAIVYPADIIIGPVAMPVMQNFAPVEYPVTIDSFSSTTVSYPPVYSEVLSGPIVNEQHDQFNAEQPVYSNLSSPPVYGEWVTVAPPTSSAPTYQGEVVYEDSQPYTIHAGLQ